MSILQQQADTAFMALCLWRESRGETDEVKTAIAYVVMNRMLHPKWGWGKNVMAIIFQRLQFSSLTDPKDRQLTTWPVDDPVWESCLQIANNVINGNAVNPIGAANHYYDISIPAPVWAEESKFIIQLGRIKFYSL